MKHLGQLAESLSDLGPAPSEPALRAISSYLELLIGWTDRIDLVSPGTLEELIQRHIRDAFACWRLLEARDLFAAGACLDVGSGAGLPGIVFAILSPGQKFYLCEPREKRAIFLQEVRRRLGLQNVEVLAKRLEEVSAAQCADVRLATFRALRPEGELLTSVLKLAPEAMLAFITGASRPLVLPAWLIAEEIPYSFATDLTGRKIILVKSVH